MFGIFKKAGRGLFFLFVVLWLKCGKAPGPFPSVQIGSIRISATGTSPGESIRIRLDDVDLGEFSNPFTLNDVAVGLHKLCLVIRGVTTPPQMVTVKRGETAVVTFQYASSGPYVGGKAPSFAVKPIKGDSLVLSKQKGKVVLLVFFEHT
jgi:hypothetical protein